MANPLDNPASAWPLFGGTRTRVAARHAVLTPDSFVPSYRDGAAGVTVIDHINPALGAGFVQYSIRFTPRGSMPLPARKGLERFLFVVSGTVGADQELMEAGAYRYLPAETGTFLRGETEAAVMVFEKVFEPHPTLPSPPRYAGRANEVAGSPFLGNPRAILQTLLPEDPAFDLAVNLFTFEPGAALPFVETHIMEHGLLMVQGQGVYRLEDAWYPVKQGDVIWMAPYCPQWFVAMGDTPASYLYYKNVHRAPNLHAAGH